LSQKGILYAQIQIKDDFLHLFSTHVQASYLDSTEYNWNLSLLARSNQIHEISAIMKNILDTHYTYGKVLLVGDMNVDASGYEYKIHVYKYINIIEILSK
jgi:hypothetical protein